MQITLSPKADRDRPSHDIALDIRTRLAALQLPDGTSVKTVEPPPGPPVIATLLAEVYGPDADSRRAAATKVRAAFESVPFVVDVDDSFGTQPRRLRATISTDDLEFFSVEESDVFDTLAILNGGRTVGYSHRADGRQPIPIRIARAKGDRVLDERFLSTPIPANVLPGARGVVELGDVIHVAEERASFPVFRHNGRDAEMVTAEMAGAFEAPLYGMIAVGQALDAMDWAPGTKPVISLYGQPEDESVTTLLWDGEWEVTYVTFRDMGAAFGVALLGIYILVVAQFGSFRLPLVVLTPIPLTFLGIICGPLAVRRAILRHLDDRFHRPCRNHRAQLDPAGRFHPPCRSGGQDSGGDSDRGWRNPFQTNPVDGDCGDDRRGGDLVGPDFSRAGDFAPVRPFVFDAFDGTCDPGDLPGAKDLRTRKRYKRILQTSGRWHFLQSQRHPRA